MKTLNTLLSIALSFIISYGASAQCLVGNGEPKSIKYYLDGVVIPKLNDETLPNKMLKVEFSIQNSATPTRLSLVVYETPSGTFSEANASASSLFDQESGIFGPGTHSMEILLPDNPYYVYFVIGCVKDPLGPPGSNNFYESSTTATGKPVIVDADYSGDAGHGQSATKVTICHIPPGNPDNAITITVSLAAWNAHHSLHGDFLGECDDTGEVIPVQLIHFSGTKLSDNEVKLDWKTASEMNNDYIAIEKSVDINTWEEVCRVPGAPGGNSSTVRDYSCVDKRANSGGQNLVYYRPRQVDFNGAYEYHDMIRVRLQDASFSAKVDPAFPNPSQGGVIHVPYRSSDNAIVNLRILSLEGKVLMTNTFAAKPGQQVVDLALPENTLQKGFYILEVQSDEVKYTQKLYKQ